MTDEQQALRDLLAKVEAGVARPHEVFNAFDTPCQDMSLQQRAEDARNAYKGSTDAALALHNAMLPEYILQFDTQGDAWIYIPYCNGPTTNPKNYTIKGDPARAALICILKALIAKGEA